MCILQESTTLFVHVLSPPNKKHNITKCDVPVKSSRSLLLNRPEVERQTFFVNVMHFRVSKSFARDLALEPRPQGRARVRSLFLPLATGITVGSCVPMTPVLSSSRSWCGLLCTTRPKQTCALCHSADCVLAWPTTEAPLCLPRAPKNLENLENGDNQENAQTERTRRTWVPTR